MGEEEIEAIAAIAADGLPCRVTAWCRAREADVDAALQAGVTHVNISTPMSRLQIGVKLGIDVEGAAAQAARVVAYAISKGLTVALGGEDSSRADAARHRPHCARRGGRRGYAACASPTRSACSIPSPYYEHDPAGARRDRSSDRIPWP